MKATAQGVGAIGRAQPVPPALGHCCLCFSIQAPSPRPWATRLLRPYGDGDRTGVCSARVGQKPESESFVVPLGLQPGAWGRDAPDDFLKEPIYFPNFHSL